MLGHLGLVYGAGVVVKPAGYGEVYLEILLRYAECREILCHGYQLVQSLVKGRVHSAVALERLYDLGVRPLYRHEVEHVFRLARQHFHLVNKELAHLFCADLIYFVDRAHDVPGALAHAVHCIKAVEYPAVVDADPEFFQSERRESVVYDGRDLRLVYNVELSVSDYIYIGLIEFSEAAPLRALSAVDLAYLVAAERETELGIMRRDILCQRHGQVKAQRKIAVTLGEAVYLLFRLSAALGEQHLRRFNNRGVKRGKAV